MKQTIKLIPVFDEGLWELFLMFEDKLLSDLVYDQISGKKIDISLTLKSDILVFIDIKLDNNNIIAFNATIQNAQLNIIKSKYNITKFSSGYFLNGEVFYNPLVLSNVVYNHD